MVICYPFGSGFNSSRLLVTTSEIVFFIYVFWNILVFTLIYKKTISTLKNCPGQAKLKYNKYIL